MPRTLGTLAIGSFLSFRPFIGCQAAGSRRSNGVLYRSGGRRRWCPVITTRFAPFNNFGLSDSLSFASELLGRVQGNAASRNEATAKQIMDAFNVVQQVAAATGLGGGMLEVSPTPQETAETVSSSAGFGASNAIWRFDKDTLDSSDDLLEALPPSAPRTVSVLSGTHLSPVVFTLAASEIDPSLELLLGRQSFSFGSEEAVAPLINAICEWLWPTGMTSSPRRITSAGSVRADDVETVEAEFVDVALDTDCI